MCSASRSKPVTRDPRSPGLAARKIVRPGSESWRRSPWSFVHPVDRYAYSSQTADDTEPPWCMTFWSNLRMTAGVPVSNE